MIDLHIIESKDFDLIGTWQVAKNTLILGGMHCQLSDIRINNESFKQAIASLTVQKNLLWIKVLSPEVPVLINGKKTMGRAPLKVGDRLAMGHTLFGIKDFSFTDYPFGQTLAENLKKIIRGNHPLGDVVQRLEKYLRD